MSKELPASLTTNCNDCNALRQKLLNGWFMSSAKANFEKCARCRLRERGVNQ